MNTADLILRVRESLFEMEETVITDSMITRNLNRGYRFAYNTFAKENPFYIGKVFEMEVKSGVNEYQLPPNLFNKRITSVDSEYRYSRDRKYPVEKISWDKMKNYLTDDVYVATHPYAWSVL